MHWVGWTYCLTALAALAGCRASDMSGTRSEPPRAASSASSASAASGVTSASVTAPASSAAPVPVLPKLKPIATKPFPEGASEATVCEAIDSKEPDLWVRFGHLVPAYVTGAVYVLEAGPENKDKLFKYISQDYVYGYYSQQASCRGNLTLLYIRMMFDKSEFRGKPFGREHLSQAIEKKFGIKTRESFQLDNDQQRLAEYCAADSDLCDQLLLVDRGNKGEGLCGFAVAECARLQRSRPGLRESCRGLPTSALACLMFAFNGADAARCSDRVAAALCPQP